MPDDGPRAARASASEALGRSSEITRVLRRGLPLRSERVVLYLAPGGGPSRAAWIAGRKVGNAVRRNRARRLLRQAWRTLRPRIEDGWELVLVARRAIQGSKAGQVTEEIEGMLRRRGVMGP